jgi:hypothetical protein
MPGAVAVEREAMMTDDRIGRVEDRAVKLESAVVALREEFHAFRVEVAKEFGSLRAAMVEGFRSLETKLSERLGLLDSKTSDRFASLAIKTSEEIGSLKAEIVKAKLWMLVTGISQIIALAAVVGLKGH